MKRIKTLGVAACLLAGSGLALAADHAKKQAAKEAPKATSTAAAETGRDWTKIDTNKDGLVSPEEMEAWLKANPGPLKSK